MGCSGGCGGGARCDVGVRFPPHKLEFELELPSSSCPLILSLSAHDLEDLVVLLIRHARLHLQG